MNTHPNSLLRRAISHATAILLKFAQQANFIEQLQVAFGDSWDRDIAIGIGSQLRSGDFSLVPEIQVLSGGELGHANGAYAASLDRIFLSSDFLSAHENDLNAIVSVLLEEIGHKLDTVFNGQQDSPGDEGQIFSLLATGATLSTQMLSALRAENDRALIQVGGKSITVEQSVFYGTLGADDMYGYSSNDQLSGLAGNDSLYGRSGDDWLYGGDGNDQLYGEAGNDLLSGDSGDDSLYGDAGNDLLFGQNGNDWLFGNSGDDRLYDGDGNDQLYGGDGNDQLYAFAGNDLLLGGDGNDQLYGGDGNDSLAGETGNDTLDGGAGIDTLTGGTGSDRFLFSGVALTGANTVATLLGRDNIADFKKAELDKIVLSKATFTAITAAAGGSLGAQFASVASDALAATSSAVITYSTATGNLFYNQNGVAAGFGTNGGNFAVATGLPALAVSDFTIVS
jgi:Ca2+-binding RTX toxin-like protein